MVEDGPTIRRLLYKMLTRLVLYRSIARANEQRGGRGCYHVPENIKGRKIEAVVPFISRLEPSDLAGCVGKSTKSNNTPGYSEIERLHGKEITSKRLKNTTPSKNTPFAI